MSNQIIEEWKSLPDFPDYFISNLGNVKNKKGIILAGDHNNMGYRRVIFYTPYKKRFFVHRLVATLFCEGEAPDLVVNHIDGNKENNIATNLEWVTRSENDLHAYKLKLRDVWNKKPIRIYDAEIDKTFPTISEASSFLKISKNHLGNIIRGHRRNTTPYNIEIA